MDKFVYVFNESAREKLLSLGYTLLKSDDRNKMYVFENQDTLSFDVSDIDYILSNTLTF